MAINEAKDDIAEEILLESGVLKKCMYHEIIFRGNEESSAAYKLANGKFSRDNNFQELFSNRRHMTDTIQNVNDNYLSEECPICVKIRDQ